MSISRHGGRSKSWREGGHLVVSDRSGCKEFYVNCFRIDFSSVEKLLGGAVTIKGHLLKIVLLMTGPKIGGAEGTSGSTGRLNISLVIQA